MKNKIQSFMVSWHEITSRFDMVLSPIGSALKTVFVFILTCLIWYDFDLTGFSSGYLSKTFLILALVAIGVNLFLQTKNHVVLILEAYADINFWKIIGTLIVFFPLMLLGGQREMVHWMIPVLSTAALLIWVKRNKIRTLRIQRPIAMNYYQMWQQIRPKWPDVAVPSEATIPMLDKLDSILISGAGTPVGQKLLGMMVSHPPKKLVLIDSSEANIAMMQAWVKRFMPKSQVVFALSSNLATADLKSLFKTYAIKYVFDLDRCYTFSHLAGAQKNFLLRNLTFPRLLLDQAVASKIKFVITLSAIPLYDDEALETAQSVLECYAQRLDSEKTRVVVLRHRAPADGLEIIPNLMSHFWGYDKSNLLLSPTPDVAKTILTMITQFQENSVHFGAVWALTHVYEFKKVTLQRDIQPSDSFEDIAIKISALIKGLKPKIQDSDNLFPTSQAGAAIVADCPIVETDFNQCFQDVESLVEGCPEQGQKKKA